MIAVGLTGNLGSGKSTVARFFREHGAEVLDADALVHEMLAEGGEAAAAVLEEFPSAASRTGRGVDRQALARIVFHDERARRRLESILHPLVIARQDAWLEQARARGAELAVVEASLMLEAFRAGGPDPRDRFDRIVVVTCDEATQLERAVARQISRTGSTRAEAERDARARLLAQMTPSEKAALADDVIDNSGDPEETARQVAVLVSRWLLPRRD